MEALLRWPQSELGVTLPGEFIPLAEEAGLMKPIAAWVLESALALCARWRKDGLYISVAVNLSATNLLDTELPDQIRFLLALHRLGPESLILETTETTLMADRTRSREVVQRLHDLGLTISVDDFGTGFSSLAYLADLAVGELKIDRLLVNQLESEDPQKGEAIVRTAIELGHALGPPCRGRGYRNCRHSGLTDISRLRPRPGILPVQTSASREPDPALDRVRALERS